jgi:dolichol-phosphate mannosyltransferase
VTPELTVVCPMYNEAGGIARVVHQLVDAVDELGVDARFVLVDDGSTDATRETAERALGSRGEVVSYARNRGRGYALRTGFGRATGQFVIATEADLSWGPGIIAVLLGRLRAGRADVVVASPYAPGGALVGVPRWRASLSRAGNLVLARRFGVSMATGMTRGYRRAALERLVLRADDKDLHVEVLSEARRLGLAIEEVPATLTWDDARRGRGSLRWRHAATHLGWALRW